MVKDSENDGLFCMLGSKPENELCQNATLLIIYWSVISIQFFKRIFAIPPLNTELEKTKKDLAALKEQAAGLTREYDRLLDEHSKAQVSNV